MPMLSVAWFGFGCFLIGAVVGRLPAEKPHPSGAYVALAVAAFGVAYLVR